MKYVKFDFYTVRAKDTLKLNDDEQVVTVAFSDEMSGEYCGPAIFDVFTVRYLD